MGKKLDNAQQGLGIAQAAIAVFQGISEIYKSFKGKKNKK